MQIRAGEDGLHRAISGHRQERTTLGGNLTRHLCQSWWSLYRLAEYFCGIESMPPILVILKEQKDQPLQGHHLYLYTCRLI